MEDAHKDSAANRKVIFPLGYIYIYIYVCIYIYIYSFFLRYPHEDGVSHNVTQSVSCTTRSRIRANRLAWVVVVAVVTYVEEDISGNLLGESWISVAFLSAASFCGIYIYITNDPATQSAFDQMANSQARWRDRSSAALWIKKKFGSFYLFFGAPGAP